MQKGSAPYFYLPKMESHLEVRLWNDVFTHAQQALGVPHSTIRATMLIETIPAAFEMDEFLYELRDHVAGLNAGRWDYVFSVIKYFRDAGADFLLPDRGSVTMTQHMMKSYSDLVVKTCHRRRAFAMGGMAAFIPSRRDPEANQLAFSKIRQDKTREADAGFDVTADDLLAVSELEGERTLEGLRDNVSVGIEYLRSWLAGNCAVGINNLMKDAATAEISRSQIWQWLHAGVTLASGETVTRELVDSIVDAEFATLVARSEGDEEGVQLWEAARKLFYECAVADDFPAFLTLPAYAEVLRRENA